MASDLIQRRFFLLLAFGLIAAWLTGCGGGGGSSSAATSTGPGSTPQATVAGTFTDAPVAGASYTTSSGSGGCTSATPCTTDSLGQFKYAIGDSVTFTAAGITLGSTGSLQPASDGTTTVTPVNLVAGAALPTDPGPTAIAQWLQTLNSITEGTTGITSTGVLTLPSDSSTVSKLSTALSGAGIGTGASVSSVVANLQPALDAAFGANLFTVVPASTASASLAQGVNSIGVIGTVWSGTCTCGGGGTFYFQPGGSLTGFTDSGDLLAGSWSGSTSAGGGITLQLSSKGGGYGSGSIAANASAGVATIYSSAGVAQGTFTFSKITSAVAVANTTYLGGWYATFTPNAAALANGTHGGAAYFIVAPDGTVHGITDGGGNAFSGTWSSSTGQGSASFTNKQGVAVTASIDLTSASGTVTFNGQAAGTLALARNGTLTSNAKSSAPAIPLLLNVVDSWANTGGNTVTSLALGLNVYDSNGNLIASGVKSESTAPRSDGVRSSTTDNIAVPYPQGGASTYSLSVGPANCTITGGSGSINDANSGNASAYPTVYVTCDPNATQPVIPLLLNVGISWANTSTSVSSFVLGLRLANASGAQIASGIKSESTALRTDGVRTTTTDSIAVSYPTGTASTYSLSAGSQCVITGVSSGLVNDANSGNPNAYPTVAVVCP